MNKRLKELNKELRFLNKRLNSGKYDSAKDSIRRHILEFEEEYYNTEAFIRQDVNEINYIDSLLSDNKDNVKKDEREKDRVKEINRLNIKGYESQLRILNQGNFFINATTTV